MKKKKSTSDSVLAENEREAIEKAALALSAFDEEEELLVEACVEETEELNQEQSEELFETLEAAEVTDAAEEEASEEMEIWNEGAEVSAAALAESVHGEMLAGTIEEAIDDTIEAALFASEDAGTVAAAESEDIEAAPVDGTELEGFESAEIEDLEFVSEDQLMSIIESVFFSTDKPISMSFLRQIFKGTNIKGKDLRRSVEQFASELASSSRGVTLEEIGSGYQLRTKIDNVRFLRQSVKSRPFRLSGPALEVLSIVAYKQPVTKAQMDEIRGVESGHLLRALMEKGIVSFGEKSELPGKPMYYETTRKFLEIFSLRNVRELPSLHEIDQLIPEGIGDDVKKESLSDLTERLSEEVAGSYSQGEEELLKITDELSQITTSSEFFEQEKDRIREKRDRDRAQDIREAMALGDKVEDKDVRWLERFDEAQLLKQQGASEAAFVADEVSSTSNSEETAEERPVEIPL